ncbi:AMP-binding protein, partial [Streptomyces cathayae]|uniref:AMP-binding protein n=1 Tax=Streptomyces cathayae TaxID=3031124 RepID=UPI0024356D40
MSRVAVPLPQGNQANRATIFPQESTEGAERVGTDTDTLRPLPESLREHARRLGGEGRLPDRRTRRTYRDLECRTGRLADMWRGSPGAGRTGAAILLGNRVEAVESLLAVTRASGVGVPLDPGSSGAELARLLEDCGARVLITDEARLTHRRGLLSRSGLIVVV